MFSNFSGFSTQPVIRPFLPFPHVQGTSSWPSHSRQWQMMAFSFSGQSGNNFPISFPNTSWNSWSIDSQSFGSSYNCCMLIIPISIHPKSEKGIIVSTSTSHMQRAVLLGQLLSSDPRGFSAFPALVQESLSALQLP